MSLRSGQAAPLFEARSDDGRRVALRELRGEWVALFFFSGALTPAGRLEAQQFEAAQRDFQQLGAQVIGVSSDTEASQALLRQTCQLSFPLLPDAQRRIGKAYGMLGGALGLLGFNQRRTFLIDPAGRVAYVWRGVKPNRHAAEVLRELGQQQGQAGLRSQQISHGPV
ncbi:peroxiredoxin [Deinococcus detaillensis]|uniref:thioredoxin-dependent peroxiredoxin n=1 Tax=Deinococcus detaillensis TaxID=2592048 RepID=A0A553URZ0_9DEIO|nr:peroxiredoxin [Deinococcus detaillensis]TSA82999.1 peroxiredoxin [Deinococcus detaillensis]